MSINVEYYRDVLESEAEMIESELSELGYVNPENEYDWTAGADTEEIETADLNNLADADEEQSINKAVVDNLEVRLMNVKEALQRIEDGEYGVCIDCGEPIEDARLEANPSASTCIACTE